MLIYEKYFAILTIDFIDKPKYEKNNIYGDIIDSNLNLLFEFFEDENLSIKNNSLHQEIKVSLVDLTVSIDNMIKLIEEITILKNNETSNHINPLVSVDGDSEDLGISFTFTKEKQNLFIQIDRRCEDSVVIKMRVIDFKLALSKFAQKFKSQLIEMNITKNLRDSLLNKVDLL